MPPPDADKVLLREDSSVGTEETVAPSIQLTNMEDLTSCFRVSVISWPISVRAFKSSVGNFRKNRVILSRLSTNSVAKPCQVIGILFTFTRSDTSGCRLILCKVRRRTVTIFPICTSQITIGISSKSIVSWSAVEAIRDTIGRVRSE